MQSSPFDVRAWFLDYVSPFASPYALLKKDHSLRVMANARALSEALSWPPDAVSISSAAALLHDIGHFTPSPDHGEHGREILLSAFPWEHCNLPPDPILDTARYHNKRDIPDCPPHTLPTVRLVRDADKIDILELIRDYALRNRLPEIYPGIVPGPLSPHLTSSRPPTEEAATTSDLLLVKLTWVYDMNFTPTLRHLSMTGLLDWFCSQLPSPIVSPIRSYVDSRLLHNLPE